MVALNDLDLQCADIQNAYLTAPAIEKCYMIAGPEFREEEGKTFVIERVLYRLKDSTAVFRNFLAEVLEDISFYLSYTNPDKRMRAAIKPNGEEYYEYILCYVDDIIYMSVKATKVIKEI